MRNKSDKRLPADRPREINKKRYKQARELAFQRGLNIASHIPDDIAIHELALAMLYLGEGNKTGNRVQIASVDPLILKYFLWAVEKLYHLDRETVSLRLHLVKAAHPLEEQMIQWWAMQLSCSITQFKKTQYDSRSKQDRITGDYHGVCTITYNDTYLFEHLLGVYSTYIEQNVGE